MSKAKTATSDRDKQESEVNERMTHILKQMHSPRNFAAPPQFVVGMKQD